MPDHLEGDAKTAKMAIYMAVYTHTDTHTI